MGTETSRKTSACVACAVQAVEACVSWASWALNQGLITTSDLHHAAPSSTCPATAQSTASKAPTTAPGDITGLRLRVVNTSCCHCHQIARNELYHFSITGSIAHKLLTITPVKCCQRHTTCRAKALPSPGIWWQGMMLHGAYSSGTLPQSLSLQRHCCLCCACLSVLCMLACAVHADLLLRGAANA